LIAKTIEEDRFSDSDALSQQAMLLEKAVHEIKMLKTEIAELKSELSEKRRRTKARMPFLRNMLLSRSLLDYKLDDFSEL
jgi:hypothetical protein